MPRLYKPLDRYVLAEFWKIFIMTALGFPVLVIVIDLTEKLEKYLNRNLPWSAIALSYLYWIPDSMFMVLPAAVLFATIFSIGGFTRHSEITAAKASGISFHRMVAPIFVGSVMVTALALAIGELVPITNGKRSELLEERKFSAGSDRFNFAYAGDHGRVYKISTLNVEHRQVSGIEIERKGKGADYPSYLVSAQVAAWDSTAGWRLRKGEMHVLPDSTSDFAIGFDSLRDNQFTESPAELMAVPRAPQEMRFRELGRFIRSLERSGGDANELKVEQALKIAIPVTCIIIAIFGASLATSTQRGGTAYGIGVSLATTVLFLMLIQITKAVGGGGLVPPYLAAWIPNMLFGVLGAILLARTRT
ncbi:MAG: LptF/LptG family permease [Gemmatimonadota bacterium]|nr:LptF/LptG family permease [Gemmatimonadota bacterium]